MIYLAPWDKSDKKNYSLNFSNQTKRFLYKTTVFLTSKDPSPMPRTIAPRARADTART
jgi:hypothetical protein